MKNGRLRRTVREAGFDALITVDASMMHRNASRPTPRWSWVLIIRSNRLENVLLSLPLLLDVLPTATSGVFTVIALVGVTPNDQCEPDVRSEE